MLDWEEKKRLTEIAHLYYLEDCTQEQISQKVGVSRSLISKLLQKARDLGLVEIYIKDEDFRIVQLEYQLEQKYGLQDVVVVAASGMTSEAKKREIGRAGGYYLSKNLKGAASIGISWGSTLLELVKEYPVEQRGEVKVIPLVGGLGTHYVEIHANQLAYELAKKMNSSCSYLYAPAIVESKERRDRLVAMKDIYSVLEEGEDVDVALISVGNPYHEQSTLKVLEYIQDKDLEQLREQGAVADIASRFVDRSGNEVNHPVNDRVIGLPLEKLKRIKKVIGVVDGTHKLEGVLAALQGGYIDALIIDDQTALTLTNEG
ncbi:sugar-binding transcriptional regulator [Ectobacillus ponti]|uniref:Sugar-binding transcriptional regulator n=1 Tax=Ectobacillus ponti TaxID=2961894 RepID=A0AA41XBJ8_9BACI|nr:sugar-binding transcriptional regulator [Ectobacillus ponti]MCP8970653.1 sugar-binding transcriptional regulator [Ectobacillus ponti]